MSEIWKRSDGQPLKFQYGDCVEIDTSDNPARVYDLPFRSGYVRGYDISEGSVAYELYWDGVWLQWVKEEYLIKIPDKLPHARHISEPCALCGYW